MKQLLIFLCGFFLLMRCGYLAHQKDFIESNQVNFNKVAAFFDLAQNVDSLDQTLLFFRLSSQDPINWISIEESDIKLAKHYYFSKNEILVLFNPGHTSTNVFSKHKGSLLKNMLDYKYYPDSIEFQVFQEVIGTLVFTLKSDFGVQYRYYFFDSEKGMFETGITLTGNPKLISINRQGSLVFAKLSNQQMIELKHKGTIARDWINGSEQVLVYPHEKYDFDSVKIEKW